MAKKRFYGKGIPSIDPNELRGLLVVIEGADGSGRTTQSALLRDWLGRLGYPTIEVGLKRSSLVGAELDEAMKGNTLNPRTLTLFYATDFADQLEHNIIPSLRAGFVVIADRYIYTLMARAIIRDAEPAWIRAVYEIAIVPDVIFYLKADPKLLAERSFRKTGTLDYWESGMDIQRSGDMYQCFVRYQTEMQREFQRISDEYDFVTVDGNTEPLEIHKNIQKEMTRVLSRQGQKVVKPALRALPSKLPKEARAPQAPLSRIKRDRSEMSSSESRSTSETSESYSDDRPAPTVLRRKVRRKIAVGLKSIRKN